MIIFDILATMLVAVTTVTILVDWTANMNPTYTRQWSAFGGMLMLIVILAIWT